MAYREVWAIDFEFRAPPGHTPDVICCVALELISGRRLRLWGPELRICPFNPGADTLFVAYFASAEVSCFLQLGWPVPCRWLDLYAEFRLVTNGKPPASGRGLLGALAHYGLSGIAPAEKKQLRDRIILGPPFSAAERQDILDYCESDVDALAALMPAMEPEIATSQVRFNQALLRGRYVCAVAAMEQRGVPIDADLLSDLRANWDGIKALLIDEVDRDFRVFEGASFRQAKFLELAEHRGWWPWPTLPTGAPSLEAKTFREMAEVFPELEPLRQLRSTLGELRLNDIAVGPDGRNRTLLSPFSTKTGRNAPSSSKFIFGPSVWARFMIRPEPGMALAYLDFAAQEIAIAAALSGDERLAEAALSGDPYLAFAKAANLAPTYATKQSHPEIRDRMKAVVLGVGYGMGAQTLAFRLQVNESEARHLLRLYEEAYPKFAQWREQHLDRSLLGITPTTLFGWQFEPDGDTRPNTLRNWPIQAAGAEILRWTCSLGVERGINICCPIHDAVLIEAPIAEIAHEAERMKAVMQEASRIVLGGMSIRVDTKIVEAPDRYTDKRGSALFGRVVRLLRDLRVSAPIGIRSAIGGGDPIGAERGPIGDRGPIGG